jgi:hypothetical protein
LSCVKFLYSRMKGPLHGCNLAAAELNERIYNPL